jgi:DNA repair exonuclease SbcCD ATPase subunit
MWQRFARGVILKMSEPAFFEWIEIERFRGFADRQRIDLEASVVILWGANGTGKTSFFDALQWLLVGSVDRLEPWRLRRNAEHIVNRYSADSGEPADVAAGLLVNGRRVELHRSGRYSASQLEWRDPEGIRYEEDAERMLASVLTPVGRMSLKRSLLSSGLLQQDVIREVLEDRPAQRYEHLAAMLGLDAIANFPAAAKKRAERLVADADNARKHYADIEATIRQRNERADALKQRAVAAPDRGGTQARLRDCLKKYEALLELRVDLPAGPAEAADLRNAAGATFELLSGLDDERPQRPAFVSKPKSDELDKLRMGAEQAASALDAAKQEVVEAELRYREEQAVSDRLSRLAREAIPLLGERCPVCTQEIIPDEVHRHLEELMDQGSPELQLLEERLTVARSRADELSEEASTLTEKLHAAERVERELAEFEDANEEWRARVEDVLDRQAALVAFPARSKVIAGDAEALGALCVALEELAKAATDLHAALSWAPEVAPLAAVQDEIGELQEQAQEAREKASAASALEDEARALQRAAVRAAAQLTEERFDVLRPVIQDIYGRLDPHPTFRGLRFAVDVYREKGVASPEVVDDDAAVDADPLLVFSSSQANVVALSAFLALGWAAGEDAMPFLLLDDPLQSLDDVNSLGFADLCRHMRARRQLIVSTHDERLASLLERKLAPRAKDQRTRTLQFVAWNRSGPIIEPAEVEAQLDQTNRLMLATA